ncbi:hypothetical protein [Primorskyibacter sp. 2E233]|uniref:hypothetical protein n=1 Tax=Primorskyibacter sp. 2E233 TaxID=3413431 RepID=UPI003BF2A267
MSVTFTLLLAAGVGFRLTTAWALRRRFAVGLSVPPMLASLLVVLSALPDWLKPLPFPFPFAFTLGALLPDVLFRRV